MSADAHGHRHSEEWLTPNQKSVALSLFVIAALFATLFYLVKRGESVASQLPVPAHRAEARRAEASAPIARPAARDPRVFPAGPLGGRMRYVAGLERRFQRRGRQLTVQATGPDSTTFQLSYAASAADQKHLDELQRAEALHRELRARGFTRMSLRIGDREVFGKAL